MKARRGVTLVEVMVAGMLLSFLAIGLFEGSAFAARLAKENAEYLAADAFAFDLAWKRFHEDYSKLKAIAQQNNGAGKAYVETISASAVPALVRNTKTTTSSKTKVASTSPDAPTARTTICAAKNQSGTTDDSAITITVDVEWGPSTSRRHRSVTVYRSERGQEEAKQ